MSQIIPMSTTSDTDISTERLSLRSGLRSMTVGDVPSKIASNSSFSSIEKDSELQKVHDRKEEETPRSMLAKSVRNFAPKSSEVESLFEKYRALVPSCVVNKYIREAEDQVRRGINNVPLEISAYAESYWGAVLFADISGFSKLAEKLQVELGEGAKAAETLSRYVGKSLDIMVKLISSNNGDVIKFAGDAILAVFPASSFSNNHAAATLRCAQVGLKLAALELVAGPQRLAVHCGMGAGTLVGYHVGGIYNRWEYAVTGDPILQIGSAEPEAEAGQLVIAGACLPWLKRGLVQKMPKALRTMMEEELIKADHEQRKSSLSSQSDFATTQKDLSDGFPFDGKQLHPSGNFLLESIDVGMTLLHHSVSTGDLSHGDAKTFRSVLSQAMPVLRNYIPRPVLIALDAGQSVWSAQFFRVTTLFVRLSGLTYDNIEYLSTLQHVIQAVQKDIYSFYGTMCRFIVDDKGSGILVAFGLPPFETSENGPLRGVKCGLA
jgi:class 3 adenylate cyclase